MQRRFVYSPLAPVAASTKTQIIEIIDRENDLSLFDFLMFIIVYIRHCRLSEQRLSVIGNFVHCLRVFVFSSSPPVLDPCEFSISFMNSKSDLFNVESSSSNIARASSIRSSTFDPVMQQHSWDSELSDRNRHWSIGDIVR